MSQDNWRLDLLIVVECTCRYVYARGVSSYPIISFPDVDSKAVAAKMQFGRK